MTTHAESETDRLLTAEDVEHMCIPDKRVELVRGRLVVSEPPAPEHAGVQARLIHFLMSWVLPRDLGVVYGESGWKTESNPDSVRAPDVSFLAKERIGEIPPRGFPATAPDLAIEVLSPDDRRGKRLAKVAQWLEAGARLVWVVDPMRRNALVYRPDGSVSLVAADGALDGEDVLPGFGCALADVLG